LEVIWFRFLLLFAFGSSFLFALMLATVLAGIGIGGCLGGFWLGRYDGAQRWAGLIAVGVGLMTVVSYWSYARPADSLPSFLWYSWLVARLMLPAALFSGVLFTLLGRALRDEFDHETRAAGILTLSNTLGAMIGAPLAALVLLPSLGIEASLFLVSMSYTVVAVAFALADRPTLRRRRWLTFGALAAFLAIMAFFPFGLMRNRFYPQVLRTFLDGDTRLVAFREGLCETIGYLRTDWWGTPAYFRLITNNYSMSATTFHSKRYMKLFVYWAVAARPDAREALLVSYGVGMTADALTRTRSLEKIDVVDISPDILAMSDVVFGGRGRGPLSDPRVRVHVDDGRFFLQTTGERYDIITSEPPPPRGAGVVNLYSREYFELMRARLNPGGVVTYWLPVGQLPLSESRTVTVAFCQAFPDCSLWNGGGYDWILAGGRAGGAPVTDEGFTRQWNDPSVRDDMIRVALENPEMLGAAFIADDDHPHRLGQRKANASDIHYYGALADTIKTRRRFQASAWIKRFWPTALAERTIAWFDVQRIINERYTKRRYGSQIEDLFRVLTTTQLRTTPLMQLDSYWPLTDIVRDPAMERVVSPFLDYHRGAAAMADRRYGEAARLFAHAEQNGSSFEGLFLYKALALALDSRPGEALTALRGSSVDTHVPWIAESRAWLERHIESQQRLK
jgi:spermidine synthase